MPGISFGSAAARVTTDLISQLKNPSPAALFALLRTEKLNALRKLAEIFQGQISQKNKPETTETQTKIMEKNQNKTHPPPMVEPQVVTIQASQHPKQDIRLNQEHQNL